MWPLVIVGTGPKNQSTTALRVVFVHLSDRR
jgi:hypothetical protein